MKKLSMVLAGLASMFVGSVAFASDIDYLSSSSVKQVYLDVNVFKFQPDSSSKDLDLTKIYNKSGDTEGFVKDLSYYGKVSVVNHSTFVTLDGKPAVSKVSSESSTLLGSANEQTSKEFSSIFLPVITDDNRVVLRYDLSFTNYLKSYKYQQTVSLKSGETLVSPGLTTNLEEKSNTQMIFTIKPVIEADLK